MGRGRAQPRSHQTDLTTCMLNRSYHVISCDCGFDTCPFSLFSLYRFHFAIHTGPTYSCDQSLEGSRYKFCGSGIDFQASTYPSRRNRGRRLMLTHKSLAGKKYLRICIENNTASPRCVNAFDLVVSIYLHLGNPYHSILP